MEIDTARRKARRNWARWSFLFIMGWGSVIMGSILFHPAREAIAIALGSASMPIVGIFGVASAIVLGYLGFSAMENTFKK